MLMQIVILDASHCSVVLEVVKELGADHSLVPNGSHFVMFVRGHLDVLSAVQNRVEAMNLTGKFEAIDF